jgi:hypothetical protein
MNSTLKSYQSTYLHIDRGSDVGQARFRLFLNFIKFFMIYFFWYVYFMFINCLSASSFKIDNLNYQTKLKLFW